MIKMKVTKKMNSVQQPAAVSTHRVATIGGVTYVAMEVLKRPEPARKRKRK